MKKIFPVLLVLVLLVIAFLVGRMHTASVPVAAANKPTILYYVDPMHPSYKSDKPGIAPDCGMPLEPVYSDGGAASGTVASGPARPGVVNINLQQQQLIGLQVATVVKTSGQDHLQVPGRVVADDTRTYRLAASLGGVISATFDHSVGSRVKKDEVLAVFDSPDLVAAEQTFLQGMRRAPENKYQFASTKDWKDQYLKLAAERLRSLGMSEAQFEQLVATQQPVQTLQIVSPVDGIILSRSLSSGQQVERGTEFYRIADLNHIWILASLNANDAEALHPGTEATVSLPNQGKRWKARVSNALPQFDPTTRSMQVRLEAENPGLTLRPDMFVNVELGVHYPDGLTVPQEALLDSGLTKRVYVDLGGGAFEPRQVETGRRSGDRVEIKSGLAAGEKVVVSGTFLLDSESRLKAPKTMQPQKVESVSSPAHSMSSSKMLKDPVCGMDVDPAKSIAAGNFESVRGKTYYFCSPTCRDKFHKDPKSYAVAGTNDTTSGSMQIGPGGGQ